LRFLFDGVIYNNYGTFSAQALVIATRELRYGEEKTDTEIAPETRRSRQGPLLAEVQAQIVEERGPLGPKGSLIFRIRVEGDPDPRFIDVREDQLEVIPAES